MKVSHSCQHRQSQGRQFQKGLAQFVPSIRHGATHTDKQRPDGFRVNTHLFRLSLLSSFILCSFSFNAKAETPIFDNFGSPVDTTRIGVPFVNVYGGQTLQVNQGIDDRVILNWESFNVSQNSEVEFIQPSSSSIALNRVVGNSNLPSFINGRITANGRVYIINHDGIVFGEHAIVNTHSLVASTLDIKNDVFLDMGIENAVFDLYKQADGSRRPAFFKNFARPMGEIRFDKGASVTSGKNGRVMVFAPTITNAGDITSEEGQIILAAAMDEVYLAAADTDQSDLRGLVVGVKTGGEVTNLGSLIAERGNISLLGLAVNQSGLARATTSTSLNGSIILQAQDFDSNIAGGIIAGSDTTNYTFGPSRGGVVTLAENSVTEVIPDEQADADGNAVTATDALVQKVSTIDIRAEKIIFKSDSRVTATGGDISIEAATSPLLPAGFTGLSNPDAQAAAVVIERGAIIDASGDDTAVVSVSRNFVKVEARGNELADSPLQRNGAIRDKTLTVDIREGTDFLNIDGPVAAIERDVHERLSVGGKVTIESVGNIDVEQGAVIDISGGGVTYTTDFVSSSKLVTAGGEVHDISDADKNLSYVGVLDEILVNHDKWGITEQYQTALGYVEQGYWQGSDAGALKLNAPGIRFEGTLLAASTAGIHQQLAPDALADGGFNALSRNYNQVPVGGKLIIQHLNNQLQDIVIGEDEALASENDHPVSASDALVLAPALFTESGVSRVNIDNAGRIIVNRSLEMQAFSDIALHGTQVFVSSDIHSAGGDVSLTASQDIASKLGNVFPEFKDASTSLVKVDGTIDVSGTWVNNSVLANGQQAVVPVVTQGGDILIASDLDVVVSADSLLDVSGGAYLDSNGKFTAGKGGEIRLIGAASDSDLRNIAVSNLDIQGELRGFGLKNGGSLVVQAENIRIVDAARADDNLVPDYYLKGNEVFSQELNDAGSRNILRVGADVVQRGGFSSYAFNAVGSSSASDDTGVVVDTSVKINLISATPIVDTAALQLAITNADNNFNVFTNNADPLSLLPTGTGVDAFTRIGILPEYERKAVDLTLTNLNVNGGGLVEIGENAVIQGEVGASITLLSNSNIFIDGSIVAPAGKIDVVLANGGGLAGINSQIYLGDNAYLAANGVVRADPSNALGLKTGEVFDAGEVNLTANSGSVYAQQGAKINVDAASELFDINRNGVVVSTIDYGNAGRISLTAAESLIYSGELSAAAFGWGQGGQLSISLSPENRGALLPNPNDPLDGIYRGEFVAILDDYADLPLDFAVDLTDNLRGKAFVPVQQLKTGGFDSLTVTVRGSGLDRPDTVDSVSVIEFSADLSLALDRQIILDAAVFRAIGDVDVALQAPYVALGSSDTKYPLDGSFYTKTNVVNSNFTQPTAVDVISLAATAGDGSLLVKADLVELVGEMVTQGFGVAGERLQTDGTLAGQASVAFVANKDFRLRGIRYENRGSLSFDGTFNSASDVSITAERIYPTTLTDFVLSVEGTDGSIEFTGLANTSQSAPLSIGGGININADHIRQDSNVYAPLGRLEFNAAQHLELTETSLTSSSGFGVQAPFFTTQPGGDLVVVTPGSVESDIVFTETLTEAAFDRLLPEQFILLNSSTIDVREGASFDVRGGTDARTTEFVPGPGGSRDILLADLDAGDAVDANSSFAIIPGISQFAPYDPILSSQADSVQGIAIGDTIVLEEGTADLPAGSYAILPARYALFGGYLVTPVAGTRDIYSGLNFSAADGSKVVAGRYGVAGSDIVSSRNQAFSIASADIVRSRAEYLETPLADIYTEGNLRSPNDAGTLNIEVRDNLLLAGQLVAAESADAGLPGRGSQVSIISDIVSIVLASDGSGVNLAVDQLEGLGADSLLIGGRSNTSAEGLLIESVASEVSVDAGVEIDVPELILVADVIDVRSTPTAITRLQSSGPANSEAERLIIVGDAANGINGDAAVLAVSNRTLTLERAAPTGSGTGQLTVSDDTTLQASGSIVVDVAGDIVFSAGLEAQGALINLGASAVSIGETEGQSIASGLVLSNNALTGLDGSRLRLRSDNTIDIYGQLFNVNDGNEIKFSELDLDSQGLVGFANDKDTTRVSANTFTLSNSTGNNLADAGATTNASALNVSADRVNLADGTFKIQGYSAVNLIANNAVLLSGDGELISEAALNIDAPIITGTAGADYTITAQAAKLSVVGADASAAVPDVAGLAASLILQGDAIDFAGRVALPSGKVTLHQLGNTGSPVSGNNIEIRSEAIIDVAGITQAFGPKTVVTGGGNIQILADTGDINVDTGSEMNVSAGLSLGEAGGIEFESANGQTAIATGAKFIAEGNGGSFLLDSQTLSANGINDALAYTELSKLLSSNFKDQRSIRLRNQGIEHAESLIVNAHNVRLVSDTENVVIRGTIDASGQGLDTVRENGGRIVIAAGDSVDVESTAILLARGSADNTGTSEVGTKGGKVEFIALDADNDDPGFANDKVNLKAGATIDVSGGDNPVFSAKDDLITAAQTLGGEVLVHTRLIDATTGSFVLGDLDATVTGAAKTDLVVTNKVEILDGEIDSADITALYNETKTFMDNAVASVNGFRVAPGLDVWSSGDLTLKDEWNFNRQTGRAASPAFGALKAEAAIAANPGWHFGETTTDNGVAGYLTLRTAGDLIFEAGITDAFYIELGNRFVKQPDIERLSRSPESWSYAIAAGADLSSADSLAVNTGIGDIGLLTELDIRTGTGDIALVAGNDINFTDPAAAIYTAGYDRGISQHFADALPRDENATGFGFTDTYQLHLWLGGGATFPVDGGDVNVYAGGDIVSTTAPGLPTEWQPRIGTTELGGIALEAGLVPANWGVAFNRFKGGFGALGGGTLDVKSEGDVINIVLAVPTTGRTVAGSVYDSVNKFESALEITEVAGGGILKVDIAGDADNVQYYLGDGVAEINIAGDSGNESTGSGTEIYTGFDSQIKLTAGGELNLTEISDFGSVAISNSQGNLTGPDILLGGLSVLDASYYQGGFFTYSASNTLDLHALSGKTTIDVSDDLLPPVFKVVSHSNDLAIDSQALNQYPSGQGQIELIAANDIVVVTSFLNSVLTQVAYDAALLSNIQDPLSSADILTIEATDPIHIADTQQSLIIARDGSISTTGSALWDIELAESLYMQAGQDIVNLAVKVQNNRADDITSFIAGGDIRQPTQRDNNTGKFKSFTDLDLDKVTVNQFEISGPGTVEFLAGREIDLGTSYGIETVGNNKNRFLPDGGADLILMAGLGGDVDTASFATTYFIERKVPVIVTKIDTAGGVAVAADIYTDGERFYADGSGEQQGNLVLLSAEETASLGLSGIDISDGISTEDTTREIDGIKVVIATAEVRGEQVERIERVDYRNNLSAYLAQRNINLQGNDPIATFQSLDESVKRRLLTDLLFTEIKDGGTYAVLSGKLDYSRSLDAIDSLFPQNNPDGGISLLLSQVQTLDGGDINMLVPGGGINAGAASTDIIKKNVTDLGVFTALAGDVNILVEQDLLVNSSRVFSLEGDLLVWSSNGNIDAGKGAKTVTSLPSTNWELDAYGDMQLLTDPAVSGSGLQGAGVTLFAPNGLINAGDAGIKATDGIFLGAPQVLGADNIDVGGASVGVPTAPAGAGASVAGAGDATKSATDIAATVTDFGTEDEGSTTLGILSVNVEGFGNSSESKLEREN